MKAISLDIYNGKTTLGLRNFLKRYMFSFDYIKDKAVLDIPCGSGLGIMFCKHFSRNITGLELDDDLIKYAKEKYNLDIVKGDMRKHLPFKDNTFDVILCFEGLEHVNEKEGVIFLKEIKRILKDGGYFVGSTPDPHITENRFESEYHPCCYSREGLMKALYVLTEEWDAIKIRTDYLQATFLFSCLVRKLSVKKNENLIMETTESEWKDCQKFEYEWWIKVLKRVGSPKIGCPAISEDEKIIEKLKKASNGKIVVDVGAGPLGGIVRGLPCKVGIAVEPLANKFEEMGWKIDNSNYITINAPGENIPLLDNYADVVCTMNALDHTQDANQCMKEMVRILKLGGKLFVNVDIRKPNQRGIGHKIAINQDFFHESADLLNLKILHEQIEHYERKNKLETYVGIFEKESRN